MNISRLSLINKFLVITFLFTLISCKKHDEFRGRVKYVSNEPFKVIVLKSNSTQYKLYTDLDIDLKSFVGDSVRIVARLDSTNSNYIMRKTLNVKLIQIIN